MLARECAETRARLFVGPQRALVVVLRIGRDIVGDRSCLGRERGAMLGIAHQGLDPALRSVVLGQVVVEEQPAEENPAADVGERPEGEEPVRRLDERGDVAVLTLDPLDDAADRLVDERDPQVLDVGHGPDYGRFPRVRHAIWAAVTRRTTANSLRSVASGTLSASRAPPKAAPTEASPTTRAPRHWTLPYRCWRHTPTMTVGMMASSEVASAWSWVSPSHVSVGTNRIPPPTPNRPERTPAASPSRIARTYVISRAGRWRCRRAGARKRRRACARAVVAAAKRRRARRARRVRRVAPRSPSARRRGRRTRSCPPSR